MTPGAGQLDAPARRRAQGFTLLESLIAATLMGVVVLAVITGIVSAQQVSLEGQKRILASMAADDLMLEMTTLPYINLQGLNGFEQTLGALESLDGEPYPGTFWALGRRVAAEQTTYDEPRLGVTIRGMRMSVTVFDEFTDLLTIETFIPEPSP